VIDWLKRPRVVHNDAPTINLAAGLGRSGRKQFAVLRVAKIKSMAALRHSLQHTFREQPTLNADHEKTPANEVLVGSRDSKEICDRWHELAPDKVRANAVRAVEYLVTGSREAIAAMTPAQQRAYFVEALDWIKAKHGADNILSAVIHNDETTPHLTAMVIPLDDRQRLNARQFIGGDRNVLGLMQTEFAEKVGQAHGLQRGIEKSPARHQDIREFYAREINGGASARLRPVEAPVDAPKPAPLPTAPNITQRAVAAPAAVQRPVVAPVPTLSTVEQAAQNYRRQVYGDKVLDARTADGELRGDKFRRLSVEERLNDPDMAGAQRQLVSLQQVAGQRLGSGSDDALLGIIIDKLNAGEKVGQRLVAKPVQAPPEPEIEVFRPKI
jgi:hypothetical protein